MELIVLGAGPAYTNVPGALGASYLLLHDGHALGVFGEGLAAQHQIVGVEQITQQCDGLAEHPGPVRQQLPGLLP